MEHQNPYEHTIAESHASATGTNMEVCVLCGKVTDVPITEPLEQRMNYLPGAGQLCKECAIENIQEEQAAMRSGFVYRIPVYKKETERSK